MNTLDWIVVLTVLLILGVGIWSVLRPQRRSPPVKDVQVVVPAAAEENSVNSAPEADALILGDIENPLVEIAPMDFSHRSLNRMRVDPSMQSAIAPLLQRVPELLQLGREMTAKGYRLVFSPEVTRALQKGTLELVPSAGELLPVARQVGNPKKFVKLGRAVQQGGVRLANVAAASWQIAAIATAQHYLGEINARLQRLEDRVADIQFFQKEEKRAELRAAIHLLRQYHSAIARGDLHAAETTAIYQKLEDLEHNCLAIGELARELAQREFNKLETLKINESTDPRGSADRAKQWAEQCYESLELIVLVQSCRVLGCQVKAALPGDRTLLRQRIAHATDEVRIAGERILGLQNRFHDTVVKPLNPKGKWWRPFHSNHSPKAEHSFARLAITATELMQYLEAQAGHASQFTAQIDQLANSGLTLDVRLDAKGELEILSVQPT
jgi:hypothetical protein